jgi:hypothetical protein
MFVGKATKPKQIGGARWLYLQIPGWVVKGYFTGPVPDNCFFPGSVWLFHDAREIS